MTYTPRLLAYHVHLFLLHIGAAMALYDHQLRWLTLSAALYVFLQMFGGNIALHRYFTHRSFTTGPYRENFLLLIANLTCLGSSLSWIATHHHHHLHADLDSDCHSPQHLSTARILLGFWNKTEEPTRLLKNLPRVKAHAFFHRWYYLLHFSLIFVLAACGWKVFAYCYALPNLLVFYALYSVVIFCHSFGFRNFDTNDRSYNNTPVALLTLGEGWHNNHHQYPKRHRNTHRRWELDPTARVIEWFFDASRL